MFKLVVLFSVAAMAMAKPSVVAPIVYSSLVPASSSVSEYGSNIVHPSPILYRAPVVVGAPAVVPAVAPYQPAVVLDPVHGVPLDTPEVVAARAAHFRAKALGSYHLLRKRSIAVAPLSYPAVVSPVSYASYPAGSWGLPAAVGYSAAYPRALSWHPY